LGLRPDDVAAEAVKAVELAPDDPATLMRAGHVLLGRDRVAARSCASRANELAKPDFVLMGGLDNLNGLLAAFAGEDELAEEKLRSAVDREPSSESFAKNLAVFLAERGRLQEGAEVLDEAIKHIEHKDELERMRDRMAAEAASS
jgi:Flp pilus assembly protein TadD